MSSKSASETYVSSIANSRTVKTTGTSSSVSLSTTADDIAHPAINTTTSKIFKNTTCGLQVIEAYATNGTAAAGGTMTFTFDATASTVSGTPDGKSITLTDSAGEVRTYTCRERVAAVKVDALVLTGFTTGTDRMGFTVPTDSGGAGSIINIQLCNDTNGSLSAGSGVIGVGTSGASASTVAEAVRDAINGTVNARVHFGSGISTGGVVGITSAIGTGAEKVSLTATTAGVSGNDIVVANTAGDAAVAGNLAGGSGPNTSTKSEFDAGATATLTADNFKAAVDDPIDGHGTAKFTTTVNSSAGVVVVTAVDTGLDTNTIISRSGWDDICSVNAPNYFASGAAAITPELTVEFSHNGTDWSTGVVVIADLDLTNTGVKIANVDLSSYTAPYARFRINANGALIGSSSGTHQSFYVT